jgi:N-acetylglutamate synthase-like GNAT family acetyltransferase/mannose-6-phosphate isomerase-like protein (cupin superfamily)
MTDAFEFRLAAREDEPALRSLLAAASLPVDDLSMDTQEYVLAFSGGALVGSVGLEQRVDSALLRSFAVVPSLRRRGLGTELFQRIVARALLRGVKTAYVLTTTAERYCLAHGFERIERAQVPAAIASTQQFRSICPSTAGCFRRRLDAAAVHVPKDVLTLRPDVPGATMWAVALDRAMLTYFELQPHARFERHRHESEQITMVLEGELFFEVDGATEIRVRAGEVIALPANAPHAAWTRELPARAVDAWSPPRPDLVRQ